MSQDVPQHVNRFDDGYLPTARTEDLVVTHSTDETLVYDELSHHIHRLNAVSTAVWNACDGRRTVNSIANHLRSEHRMPASDQSVRLALQLLLEANLLQTTTQPTAISRRKVSKMIAAGAVPAIISISAPRASAAFSVDPDGSGPQCYSNSHCLPYQFCTWVESMGDLPGDCL